MSSTKNFIKLSLLVFSLFNLNMYSNAQLGLNKIKKGIENNKEKNNEESTEETKEEVVARQPEKLEKSTSQNPMSSPYHEAHKGEIVFSDQVIAFKNEDPTKLKTEFNFGEVIRFRAYYHQSVFNTMVDRFNELGISKDSAYAKGFEPVNKVKYFVDNELIYETVYASNERSYNNVSFPPRYFMDSEKGFEVNVKYTTYQGTLFNTEYSHSEISHFAKVIPHLTPGMHKITMQVMAVDFQDLENKDKEVLMAEGSFDLNYKEIDLSENAAICFPKSISNAEAESLVKNKIRNETYEKLTLYKVSNTSDMDGKKQEIKIYIGSREAEKCYSTYRIYKRKYNYTTQQYSDELELTHSSTTEIPCGCLK